MLQTLADITTTLALWLHAGLAVGIPLGKFLKATAPAVPDFTDDDGRVVGEG